MLVTQIKSATLIECVIAGVCVQVLDDALQPQQPQAHNIMELLTASAEISEGAVVSLIQASAREITQEWPNSQEDRGQAWETTVHRNCGTQGNTDWLLIFCGLLACLCQCRSFLADRHV